MTNTCPKCETKNPDTLKFCGECGTQLPSIKDVEVTDTLETPKEELTTGSTFAGRYQIIEELGKGGMGRVYKVNDKETSEKIALKLIKPEISSDKNTVERFRNELTTARKIVQKNVCRMYDLGREEGNYYITMEFIAGQDLKGLIRQTGQLTVGKAVSITKQVCEGLIEAHTLGVVHRDLKPNNIMVDQGGNAKIMDFGIARTVKGKGITGSGVMIGTPQYMSPEQVEGKDIDQRSDLYSLGIILYEMLTARVPFEGDTPLTVGIKQKTEIPKEPIDFNPLISNDLNRVILKCLEKNKERRYQSAKELKSELERIEIGLPTTDRVIPERKTITSKEITVTFGLKKALLPAIALVVIVVAALLFLWKKGPNLDPNLVAVAIFENQTDNSGIDHLGRMTADLITQGLAETDLYETVPTSTVDTTSNEFQQGDFIDFLAKKTGAGRVVSGTYYLRGENLQFQSQVTNTQNQKVLFALDPVIGSVNDSDKIIRILQQEVMGLMAISLDENDKAWIQLGVRPTYEAYKEWKIGVDTFNRGEQERAAKHFKQAMDLDPDFKTPLWLIAAYYLNYGLHKEAEDLIDRARGIRADLDPVTEALVLDYAEAVLRGDGESAYQALKRASDLIGSKIFNYLIALSANGLNRPREAISRLKVLDPEGPYNKNWGGYWGNFTWAYHTLGNHKEELRIARQGLKFNPERRRFLFFEFRALTGLGRIKEIFLGLEKSLAFPPKTGWNHGRLLWETAGCLRAHGYREESFRVLNQRLSWLGDRPEEENKTRPHRYAIADTLYFLEKWEEAQEIYQGLYDENPESITSLGCLGTVAARLGDTEKAKRMSEELRNIERPYLRGTNTSWRSAIAAILGDKEQAMELIREALSEGRTYKILYWNINYESLEDYPPFIELKKPRG